MPPAKIFNFSVAEMKSVLASLMDGHVTYSLGAKIWVPKAVEPAKVTRLDCSGFIKYLVYRTATPRTNLPAGSWHQEEWCKKLLTPTDYGTEASKRDGKVRIAFRDKKGKEIRHVWLVANGFTIECTTKGGGSGPCSLPWQVRKDEASSCFVLGQMSPTTCDAFWRATPGAAK